MKVAISARIDAELAEFLERYRREYGATSRSEALESAIRSLRDGVLEEEYAAAMREWLASDDSALWEITVGDGIEPHAAR